jgi:hypothetical protein
MSDMKEDEDYVMDPAHLAEVEAAERIKQEAADAAADPATQGEWIRQSNLIYSGLAAAGLVMVQPFLTESFLDLSATICVVAFAVSIPLLAALLVLNRQEEFRRRPSRSLTVAAAKAIAEASAFTGIAAGFWHISTIAGITFLVAGCVAVGVHSSGYVHLEYDSKFRSRFLPRKPRP